MTFKHFERMNDILINTTNNYFQQYYKIAIFCLIALLICSLLIIVAYLLSLTTIKDSEKLSEYECGFEPFDNATRHPFDVHFYIVGILFLIFDVEIALIFPWVLGLQQTTWFGFYVMIIFLIIITVGFFYEWHRGALSWPTFSTVLNFFVPTLMGNKQSNAQIINVISNDFSTEIGMELTSNYNEIINCEGILFNITQWIYALPEVVLSFISLILLMLVAILHFKPVATHSEKKVFSLKIIRYTSTFLLFVLFSYIILIIFNFSPYFTYLIFTEYCIVDFYSISIKMLIIITCIFILENSIVYISNHRRHLLEYTILIILIIIFLVTMISAYNLITLFIGIMGFSLNMYVLLMYDAPESDSLESGIKYFYLSALSSGLLASGILIIYIVFQTTNFQEINFLLTDNDVSHNSAVLLHIMLYSIIYGFLFKLAAFPCHLWAPEVYEGSPNPVMAILILPIKVATFAIFVRLLVNVFHDIYILWSYIIWFTTITSMLWGCLGAFSELRTKKFMAYSSINQMGFLLIGVVAATIVSIQATLIYLIIYIVMQLGFLQIFLNTVNISDKKNRAMLYLNDFKFMAENNWIYSIIFVLILFSMAGIPPLAGFFGKYFLFSVAFDSEYYMLVIIGMFTSLISTFYYLRIIKIMWFDSPNWNVNIKNKFDFISNLNSVQRITYFNVLIFIVLFIWFILPMFYFTEFLTIANVIA